MLREKGGDLPILPKARLVALRNCDENIAGHRTDAPTLSEADTPGVSEVGLLEE